MATTKVIKDLTDLNQANSESGLKMPTGAAYSGTTEDGMIRNDTDGTSQGSTSTMQHFNGTDWKNYKNLSNTVPLVIDFLVVGGGGSAGVYTLGSSGGGAGGVKRTSNYGGSETQITGSLGTAYNVTVGPGGASPNTSLYGSNGGSSLFNGVTSIGGGGGGSDGTTTFNGLSGASGGGGGPWDTDLGLGGTGSDGSDGGKGNSAGSCGGNGCGGGGGGGFTSAGTNVKGATPNGGTGVEVNIIGGTGNFYAGGGGGAKLITANYALGGTGGSGGGGNSALVSGGAGISGTFNTGGGGGGGFALTAGNGGSGTVILRYPTFSVSSFAVTGTLDTVANTAYPITNTAYYKLEGGSGTTVTDSSGNGYNGTATSVTYAAGRFGNAAVFNNATGATTSYITLPNFMPTGNSPRAVSVWIKTTNTLYEEIFTYGSGANNGYFILRANGGGSNRLGIAFYANDHDFNAPNITDGNWHHCAVTYDGNLAKVYYDGVLIGTGTPGSVTTGASNAKISGYQYIGSIDQVRTFNSAISAGNVTSLYNEGTVLESTDGTDSILQLTTGTGTVTFS